MFFKLPLINYRNIRIYYIISFFVNLYFYEIIWVFFWNDFVTFETMGIIGALSFLLNALLEIPSGYLADRFGRKKIIISSLFSYTISGLFLTNATETLHLVIGVIFLQVGLALISGALEAFIYDYLLKIKKEFEFDKVLSTGTAIAIIANAVAIFIGGILYRHNIRLPYGLWTIAQMLATIASIRLSEYKNFKIVNSLEEKSNKYIDNKISLDLLTLLVPFSLLLGVFYFYEWSYFRTAILDIKFNLGYKIQSIIFAFISIITGVALTIIPGIRDKMNDKKLITILSYALGLCLAPFLLHIKMLAIITVFLISVIGNILTTIVTIYLNDRIKSKHRATTLSYISLITKVPFIVFTGFFGGFFDNDQIYLVVIAMLCVWLFSHIFVMKTFKRAHVS